MQENAHSFIKKVRIMKKWEFLSKIKSEELRVKSEEKIIDILLGNRGLTTKKAQEEFLHPKDPGELTTDDVGIDTESLGTAIDRIEKAITDKESIVVYADYDADGITAGAVMWEILYSLGARVMPYIPHRVDEGYGLSMKGIDSVISKLHPTLIITVDHGITAYEKVEYARSNGIEVIVTDHHVKPEVLPDCPIVHTTELAGAGVSWFTAKEILKNKGISKSSRIDETLALAAIGTIADMVPLVGPNRSIAKYGLSQLRKTTRPGFVALVKESGLVQKGLTTYDISHVIAPRLNAMGRLIHALDALRLICTTDETRAEKLAGVLGQTNKERQLLTEETVTHAKTQVESFGDKLVEKRVLVVSHRSYNPGVIGLVAGKLVEEHFRPSIVISEGDTYSKASARSIKGFNIIEAIRICSDLLVDMGGHPMAAGFTVETKNIKVFEEKIEGIAREFITDEMLIRTLIIECELPFAAITHSLWKRLSEFEPFGMGNYEPVFMTKNVYVKDSRLVGNGGKHIKLTVGTNEESEQIIFDAIGFGMGDLYGSLTTDKPIDIAYTIDMNEWNGSKKLQLKLRDLSIQN